jgi:hypothetical protein
MDQDENEKKNKFNVGDKVVFRGHKAKVIKVYHRQYFYSSDVDYWVYDIEYENGGICDDIMETALDFEDEVLLEQEKKFNRLCQCGAWAVYWASEEHSHWCPANNTFGRK